MILNVKDVQSELDRYAGGAGKGPLSLLRIVAWTVVGLLLIAFVWPTQPPKYSDSAYNHHIPSPFSKVVTLDKNDPRGFLLHKHGKNSFTIAWIGPSTLQSINKVPGHTTYTFIPADVRQRIPVIDGKRTYVDLYFIEGARIMDLYAATQAALHSGADMVVLDLNPLWIYNTAEVQGWPNLNGITFNHIAKSPSQWSVGAQFIGPADATSGVAGKYFKSIYNRWTYAQKVNRHLNWFSVLDTSVPPPASTKPLSPLQRIAQMTDPLQFWVKYRVSGSAASQHGSAIERQLQFLLGSTLSGSTVNDDVVAHLFGILAKSNRPAYVYVPPIAPTAMANARISAALARIEHHLAAQAAQHQGPYLKVQAQSLGRILPPMKFNDIIHVAEAGPMVTYLSHAVCNQLLHTHSVQTCKVLPPAKAAP